MSAEPVIDPIVERALSLVPDLEEDTPHYMPKPDPPLPLPGFTERIDWSNVFTHTVDAIRDHLPHGATVDVVTQADMVDAIESSVGETIKHLSSFISQIATAAPRLARDLTGTIDNVEANALHDYRDLSQRIDALNAGLQFVADYVVPKIGADIAAAEARGAARAQAAQQNAQDWGLHNIFAPLYAEMLKVQPAINEGVAKAENVAHLDAAAQVAALGAAVGTAFNPVRNAVHALEAESEDCVKPMCETMGPNTDLGKLLKGLKLAGELALLASLANLTEDDLVSVLTSTARKAADYISFFESHFVSGGDTIAATVTSAIAASI